MSVREILKLIEVLGGTEEAVFLCLDGILMPRSVASLFFTFPGKCSFETPKTHGAPMFTCITGNIIISDTQHYTIYDPAIVLTYSLPHLGLICSW